MNCRDVERWLMRHLDERLSPEEDARMRAHLASCDSCQRSLVAQAHARLLAADFREVRAALARADSLADRPAPEASRASTGSAGPRARRVRWLGPILAAAAAIVALSLWSSPGASSRRAFGEREVLQRIRGGPVDVKTAAYAMESGGSSRAEMLFLGPRLRLATVTERGRFVAARGGTGDFQWDFDPVEGAMSLSDREAAEPSPLDGEGLADYLQANFDLEYQGKVEVGGHPCYLLEGVGSGDDCLRVYVDELSSLVRRTERRRGSSPPRIMILSEVNPELSEQAFSPALFLERDTRVDIDWGGRTLRRVPAEALASGIDPASRHHVAIFEPDAFPADDEVFKKLSAEIANKIREDDPEALPEGRSYTSVWMPTHVEQTGPGFLDPEQPMPEGLRRKISVEDLASVASYQDLLDLLEREHGVDIELAGGASLSSEEHRFFSAVPVVAWLPLNSLAAGNELRVDCVGDRVVLRPR